MRNSSYLFLNHVITTLIASFYAVFLARSLGPDLYGTLNYGTAWYLLLIAFTYLGLDVVLGREVGRDPGAAPTLAGSTLALRASAALVISILSATIAFAAEPDATARTLIIVLSAALLSRAVWLWCQSAFAAFEDTRHVFLIEVVFRPLEVLVVALLLLFLAPKNIVVIGITHATLWWLQAAIGLSVVLRHVTKVDFCGLRAQARRLLLEGLSGALYTLTVVWFLQAPVVLFRQVAGTGDTLGHFVLAIQITGYLLVVPYLVGLVALPVLSRSASREDGKTRTAAIAMMVLIPIVGTVLGVLGMWLAPPLAALIFGERYLPAGNILGEAIWLLTPISLATSLQQIVFSHGRKIWLAALSSILGIVTMAALYLPLTKAMSYHGALLATGLGMAVWAGGLIVALVQGGVLARRPPPSPQ